MKAFSAFAAKGRWLRGNCHTHTNLSDGLKSPEEAAAAYRAAGYDFLVLTDHGRCHGDLSALQRKNFLVIGGAELHPRATSKPERTHHLIAIGVDKAPRGDTLPKGTARAAIQWIKRNGGIPVYCHPYWTGHSLDHLREGRGAFGVEVYNTTCAVAVGLGDGSVHLDHALSAGIRWTAFAVDDVHWRRRDMFGGWIMVKASALTRSAVMDAIRKKHFYATTGPEIHSLSLRRNVVRIACSPVREIVFHAVGPQGRRFAAKKRLLTEAEFDLTDKWKHTTYLRVELIDSKGRKAWSNPIWWNKGSRRWTD